MDSIRRAILERQRRREKMVSSFADEIKALMVRQLPKLLDKIKRGTTPTPEVAKILLSLESELRRAGLTDLMDTIGDVYAEEIKSLRTQWASTTKKKLVLSDTDLENIETLVSFETTATFNSITASIDNIRAAVFREVIAGVQPDVNTIVQDSAGLTRRQIETELGTNVAGFQRSVTMTKAEDLGIEHYLYSGGLIETSREFCRERDGNIYTLDEINSWDNGQGLPANIYLGGYNCLHQLLPIDKETAERLGLDTSKF